MEHQPSKTLDDGYTAGRACAVCGESTLSVVHVENLPDYVLCMNCDSAFILNQAADWAMYGSISNDYPATGQMVLKRWTTLEAVETMANSERISEQDGSEPEVEANMVAELGSKSTPPFGIGSNGTGMAEAGLAPTPPFGIGELDEFVADRSSDPAPDSVEPLEETADVSEPEPGHRYVVSLAQKTASLPSERCAHCLRRPAPRKLLFALGGDQDLGYQVPLCESCHARASARSEEQKTSKVVAHLSSVLVAGVLVVGALAAGLVNPQQIGLVQLLLIGTLGLLGYGVTAFILLRRTSQYPLSEDAQFVRSTLRLRDHEGLDFGWRNRGYAELFSSANEETRLGDLVRVSDDNANNY
jgi:F0F1-type ATP synthase assembly protein I